MKTIEVTDDVYDHLLKNVSEIGEDASVILRRLLRLPNGTSGARQEMPRTHLPNAAGSTHRGNSAIGECLNNHRFQIERDVVDRFLFVLGWLHQKHSHDFARVLELRGRKRRYFARSADELEASGESVNPRKIPNSNFWVITNNDTPKKRRMLRDVMRLLGYGPGDINTAASALN